MHIEDLFEDKARKGDGAFAIAFALMQVANQQKRIAAELNGLGLGNASTPMGAMEFLAGRIGDGMDAIANNLSDLRD